MYPRLDISATSSVVIPGKIEAVSGGDQMTTYYRAVMAQLAVLFLVIGAAPLFAQSTATIVGVVRDSGGVLPGATVTVRNVDTGLTRSGPTGEEGAYRFPALPVGPYEIRAELAGFRTTVRSGVRLLVGQEAVIDMMLELGSIQETVTVTAETPLVETTTSGLGAGHHRSRNRLASTRRPQLHRADHDATGSERKPDDRQQRVPRHLVQQQWRLSAFQRLFTGRSGHAERHRRHHLLGDRSDARTRWHSGIPRPDQRLSC